MHTGYSQILLKIQSFKNSTSLLTEIQIKPIIILHLPNKDKHFKIVIFTYYFYELVPYFHRKLDFYMRLAKSTSVHQSK